MQCRFYTTAQGGSSAWGSAALISAIDEGLAGIVDADTGYKVIVFSPRFVMTDYTELCYMTGYEVTDTLVDVKFIVTDIGVRYDIKSPAHTIHAHILLLQGKDCSKLLVNGYEQEYEISTIGESKYVNITVTASKSTSFEVIF